MKTVIVFGSFDPLHEGHFSYFRQAKEHGDKLVCVVARERTITTVKGHVPSQTEHERLQAVNASGLVDQAILGCIPDVYEVLSLVRPDVVCLGYDQSSFTEELPKQLRSRGLDAEIIRLKSHKPDQYKSSIIKENSMVSS